MNHNSHVLSTFTRTVAARIEFDRTNASHLRAYMGFCNTGKWIDTETSVEYRFVNDPRYPSLPIQVGKAIMKNAFEAIGVKDFKDEYEMAAEKPIGVALNMAQPTMQLKEAAAKAGVPVVDIPCNNEVMDMTGMLGVPGSKVWRFPNLTNLLGQGSMTPVTM
jgi:hypothetical protein